MAPRSINESYVCRVVNRSAGVDILADMPERITLSVSSSYEPLSMSIREAGRVLSGASAAIGGNIASKAATKQMWRDTGPIEFTVSLIFDAENNSFNDVHRNLVLLQHLALPIGNGSSSLGAVMLPPNPWRSTTISGQDNRTIVDLGYLFHFDPCLVLSANIVEEMRTDDTGYPIAGQIDVTFRTDYTFDRTDYLRAAGYQSARTPGAPNLEQAIQNSLNNVPGLANAANGAVDTAIGQLGRIFGLGGTP